MEGVGVVGAWGEKGGILLLLPCCWPAGVPGRRGTWSQLWTGSVGSGWVGAKWRFQGRLGLTGHLERSNSQLRNGLMINDSPNGEFIMPASIKHILNGLELGMGLT